MGERRTAREAVMSQTCHGGGNIYGRERSAVSVFTTRCISINSPLNGRKVISWILLRENMMKI